MTPTKHNHISVCDMTTAIDLAMDIS